VGKKFKNAKVVVLAGGISPEREISLRSGRGCFNALNRLGYNVSLLDLESGDQIMSLHRSDEIDVAFLCTHGAYGEDGKLQGILEWRKIPYTGSNVLASALCMNKYYTRKILKASNIEVAPGALLRDIQKDILKFPLMIKPLESGSSIGVSKINTLEELEDHAVKYHSASAQWLVEEFVAGREITVGLLQLNSELKVLPILELKSKNELYDLEAKYTKGMTEFIIPAPLNADLQRKIESIALQTFRAVGCSGFARVDMIIPERNNASPVVLEVNTLPGMTETSDLPAQAKAAGIEYDQLVELMLETAEV
jgi:D-alanine-D-alanine ligase